MQTACSTSLVAIHLACQSLLNHECDMALAGGVTIEVPHGRGYLYREGEILSRDGHCRSFDAASERDHLRQRARDRGALRRLDDAVGDGDLIHAVIRGTAINNDGARKVGYLAPASRARPMASPKRSRSWPIPADSISYIEAHGTGTAVGDPIEIAALTQAFRESTQAQRLLRDRLGQDQHRAPRRRGRRRRIHQDGARARDIGSCRRASTSSSRTR